VAITVGRITLSVAALRALTPGAVVVLDGPLDAAVARLRMGATLFHFRATGPKWTCAAITSADADRHGVGDSMSVDPKAAAVPAAAGTKLDLPLLDIAIDFDLGRVTVPLSEIESWQPGSVVALPPTAPREGVEVTLRSNGRVIGTGDLVRIDDRIAVRISSLTFGP
jgi:type III secretion system YscQ/HrcQ family protein